jgi:hypothetical protein
VPRGEPAAAESSNLSEIPKSTGASPIALLTLADGR